MKQEDTDAQTDFVIAARKEEIAAMPDVVGIIDGLHRGSFIVARVGTSSEGRNGILLELWTTNGPMIVEEGQEVNTLPLWDDQILPLADMLIAANERVAAARAAQAMAEKPKDVH